MSYWWVAEVTAGHHGRGRLVSGIVLALGAAFCYNLGLAVQKREALTLPKVDGFSWSTIIPIPALG